MRRMYLLVVAALLAVTLFVPRSSQGQTARLCFNVPHITNCIEGRFREYWEQNGGLPVFGYPITAATRQQTAEGTFLTQYFERNRFELHPEKAPPYDVLLGRLGDDLLKQQGLTWQNFTRGLQTGDCLWFKETGHSVCDHIGGFKSYWESHGLQDPALDKYQQSLALFGLPLSEASMETNAAGHTVLTQWFERARFEHHPNNPPQFRVLPGLLGVETRAPGPPGPRSLSADAVWIHSLGRVTAQAPGTPAVVLSKGASAYNPAATPDGALIAYHEQIALGQPGERLWGFDPRTGQRRVLLETPASITTWRFSPDSTSLAFALVENYDRWQLKTLDLRNGTSRVLQEGSGNFFPAPIAWTPAGLLVQQLRWGTDAPPQGLSLVDPGTGSMRSLRQDYQYAALASPDGKKVALTSGRIGPFERPEDAPEMSLSVFDTGTGGETAIVSRARAFVFPVEWAPDGSKLAYRVRDEVAGVETLHVANADGSGVQRLAFGPSGVPGELQDAAWRGGSTLLLLVGGPDGKLHLYEVALGALNRAGLKELGTFTGATRGMSEILYVPR